MNTEQLRGRRKCTKAIAVVAEVAGLSSLNDDPRVCKAMFSLQSSLLSAVELAAVQHNVLLTEVTGFRFVGIANARSKSIPSDAMNFAQALVRIVADAQASIASAYESEDGSEHHAQAVERARDGIDEFHNEHASKLSIQEPSASTVSSFVRPFLSFSFPFSTPSSPSSTPSTESKVQGSQSPNQTISSPPAKSDLPVPVQIATPASPLASPPPPLRLKVGISSSPAICGTMGILRPQFVCVGECMVRAEELMGKASPSGILLDGATRALLADEFNFREFRDSISALSFDGKEAYASNSMESSLGDIFQYDDWSVDSRIIIPN